MASLHRLERQFEKLVDPRGEIAAKVFSRFFISPSPVYQTLLLIYQTLFSVYQVLFSVYQTLFGVYLVLFLGLYTTLSGTFKAGEF